MPSGEERLRSSPLNPNSGANAIQCSVNLAFDCCGLGPSGVLPFLGAGTLGDAQKQPGILPPHFANSLQHSPPEYVWQQQSVSATFRAAIGAVGNTVKAIASPAVALIITC